MTFKSSSQLFVYDYVDLAYVCSIDNFVQETLLVIEEVLYIRANSITSHFVPALTSEDKKKDGKSVRKCKSGFTFIAGIAQKCEKSGVSLQECSSCNWSALGYPDLN